MSILPKVLRPNVAGNRQQQAVTLNRSRLLVELRLHLVTGPLHIWH